ncbi:MAG TPA: two-component regulator propeller domain-containing protein, partial [Chitinophagaceae bacterium]|nr:two-component regulator propeller domain-containing protein [Chitinophagaceae bacterium]
METLKMPALKLFFCLLLAVLPALLLCAQPQKQFTFTHYTTNTGLQSNQVNDAVQDETGYIWIGTTEGLVRFDGIRYKTFQHHQNDSSSLPSNVLEHLLLDKQKNLWVLTEGGKAGIFNTRKFTFTPVPLHPDFKGSLKSLSKYFVTDDAGNVFLLLGNQEILMWNRQSNSFQPLRNFFPIDKNWKLTSIAKQPGTQKYWIGLQQGGMAVYNALSGKTSVAGNNVENEPMLEELQKAGAPEHLMFDGKGRCWFTVTTPNYAILHMYDFSKRPVKTKQFEFFSTLKTYNEIYRIFEQTDGTIWVSGLAVLGYYIPAEERFELIPPGYENEKGIDYRTITCLFEDREMNMWVGTAINGIFRFNPSQEFFTNIKYVNRVTNDYGDNGIAAISTDVDS